MKTFTFLSIVWKFDIFGRGNLSYIYIYIYIERERERESHDILFRNSENKNAIVAVSISLKIVQWLDYARRTNVKSLFML
jgi:hypothetical protein